MDILGLFNLGLIALVGIGAYSYALFMALGLGFYLATILAILIPGYLQLVCNFNTKIKGDYFGIATLGFTYLVFAILINADFLKVLWVFQEFPNQ